MATSSRLDELTERARRTIGSSGAAAPTAPATAPRLPQTARATDGALVLGIDPGTATMGFGLVLGTSAGDGVYRSVGYGVIQTAAGVPMEQRLLQLHRRLGEIIRQYQPTQAAVEKLFFGRNTTTAIAVGQARGVALLALAEAGLPVVEYTPAEVKNAMAGYGNAGKAQMQRMVTALLGLPGPPKPDDAADAVAIALCHLRLAQMRQMGLR